MVSARYHGVVAAVQSGVPCIGIDVCPKIRALMSECGLENYCLKPAEFGRLPELLERALDERRLIAEREGAYTRRAENMVRSHLAAIREIVAPYTASTA